MLSEKMLMLGKQSSVIRAISEYGAKRKAEIGAENVFDFSLGNPSIPAPDAVREALIDLAENTDPCLLHGYTSAQGAPDVRKSCADYVNANFGTKYTADNFYMTVGAAASLTISLSAISEENGEVIILAPFILDYFFKVTFFADRLGAGASNLSSSLLLFVPNSVLCRSEICTTLSLLFTLRLLTL